MARRLAGVLLGVLAAATLGGWLVIKAGPDVTQAEVGGSVRVTLTVCQSAAGDANCPNGGNSSTFSPGSTGQLLLGFRVPVGATGPETIASTAGVPVTLTPSPSYGAELERLLPAAPGMRWVGYISSASAAPGAAEATFSVEFSLPPEHPFVGPFKIRPVVGARSVSDESPAERPVECGDDPFAGSSQPSTVTVCVDSPAPATVAVDVETPTRDFGIVAGSATVSPGQTVALPFNVRGAGALPAGLTASLVATTSLPGVSVAPSQATAPLANGSDTRVTVPVTVPRDAGPGTFAVTVTGRLENGEERSGTATLTVRDRQKPVVSRLSVKPKRFRPVTRRRPRAGTTVAYSLSEAASVRTVVERCARYARKRKGGRKRGTAKRPVRRSLVADAAARRKRGGAKRKPVARGRCLRFRAMRGATTRQAAAGANSLRFDGKVAGRPLRPGPYRLALTPTDSAGNVGDKARVGFAIRR